MPGVAHSTARPGKVAQCRTCGGSGLELVDQCGSLWGGDYMWKWIPGCPTDVFVNGGNIHRNQRKWSALKMGWEPMILLDGMSAGNTPETRCKFNNLRSPNCRQVVTFSTSSCTPCGAQGAEVRYHRHIIAAIASSFNDFQCPY